MILCSETLNCITLLIIEIHACIYLLYGVTSFFIEPERALNSLMYSLLFSTHTGQYLSCYHCGCILRILTTTYYSFIIFELVAYLKVLVTEAE
jgi:hypothetical protein